MIVLGLSTILKSLHIEGGNFFLFLSALSTSFYLFTLHPAVVT